MKSRKHKTTHTSGKCINDKSSGNIDSITVKIHENPGNALAYFARARAEKKRGNTQAAIRDYSNGLKLNPLNDIALLNRAILYIIKSNYERAIADLTSALDINPKLTAAYLERADAYKCSGKYAEAIVDYDVVILAVPDSTVALAGRRDAKYLLNDLKGAAEDQTAASNLVSFGSITNEVSGQAKTDPASGSIVSTTLSIFLKTGLSVLKAGYKVMKKYYHYYKKSYINLKDKLIHYMHNLFFILILLLNDFLSDADITALIGT